MSLPLFDSQIPLALIKAGQAVFSLTVSVKVPVTLCLFEQVV